MIYHRRVGENIDFEYPIKDDTHELIDDLSEAILQFTVTKEGETVRAIDRVPTTVVASSVFEKLTGEETIMLGAGVFNVELKTKLAGDIKKNVDKLYLKYSNTD